MMTLMRASEPQCLVTGDQSLGEATSMNKLPFYEVLPHKKKFAAQMVSLAGQINPTLQNTLKGMQIGDDPCNVEAVAQLLQNTSLGSLFAEYRAKIQEDFDLAERLATKLKREAWSQVSPSIRECLTSVQELERDIQRKIASNAPATAEDFSDMLQRGSPALNELRALTAQLRLDSQ
jgi:hypothetical protein